jgi:hypothetical protein
VLLPIEMELTMIECIQKKFGFKYPQLFHRLNADGMLDWGKTGPGWHEDCYPKLRKNPPFLLFASDFKLMQMDEVEKQIVKLKSKSGMFSRVVPFAKTGSGDLYCFVYGVTDSPDFLCKFNKRTDVSVKLAKTLDDFVFRELLGAVAEIDPDEFQDDQHSFVEDLQAMLASHRTYLPEHRFAILEKFYGEQFSERDDTFGALSLDEFLETLKQEIDFKGLDEKFDDLEYVM